MHIDFLLKQFADHPQDDAIVWRDKVYSYEWLNKEVASLQEGFNLAEEYGGAVVLLEADFSPRSTALFLALMNAGAILVPQTRSIHNQREEFIEVSQAEFAFSVDHEDRVEQTSLPGRATHDHYDTLRSKQHPGLVLFSSGSTGKSKAAVHDASHLLEKFHQPRHALRTISFLLYDHIGGINTMLYTLSSGGCLVTVGERSPDSVLSAVEKHQVELLPASPTFLNLILMSEAYQRHDASTLTTVSYGTEPMPESTLLRFHECFPGVSLKQTYGLSELGIMRSKSKSSDSLWVKLGGEGFQTRVVDGVLHIKARSTMLGYLNAETPLTEDGWFNTGDRVEVDGEFMRILGRDSELINVGGEKVYPAEVESIVQTMVNVEEVVVYGKQNAITGQMVCATVTLKQNEDLATFKRRLKKYCRERLDGYKVPVKVSISSESLHNARFKRLRKAS